MFQANIISLNDSKPACGNPTKTRNGHMFKLQFVTFEQQIKIMKKYLLSISLFAFMASAQGQLVELVNPQEVFYGTAADSGEELHPHWDITNISGETINLGSNMMIDQIVEGATYQFCWGEICSGWETENIMSTEVVTLMDGQTNSTFFGKYRHNGNAGQSKVRYCWFDADQPFNDVCYEVDFCVDAQCILGVDENAPKATIELISPNPIATTGFINYHFTGTPTSGKLTICNAIGAVVKVVDLETKDGVVIIGSAEFEDGLYFCNIEEEGRVYQTQRFMIKK